MTMRTPETEAEKPARVQRFQSGGQAIPKPPDGVVLLPLKPEHISEPFTFCHLPTRWDFKDTNHGWLPSLTRIAWMPGVNGVVGNQKGYVTNMLPAFAGFEGKGGRIIKRDNPNLPENPDGTKDYVRRHPTTAGVWHFTTLFDSYTRVGKKLIPHFDLDGYAGWLGKLMDANLIDPMPHEILFLKVETQKSRINQYESDGRIGSARVVRGINDGYKRAASMIEKWWEQFGGDKRAAEWKELWASDKAQIALFKERAGMEAVEEEVTNDPS